MEDCKRVVVCFVLISSFCGLSLGADDAVTFAAVPDSVTFNTIELLHSSEIADVLSAMLSYSLEKPYTWKSLDPVNPLKRLEAIFVLDLMGVASELHLNIKGTKFPLENRNDLDGQYTKLALRTQKRYDENSEGKPILLKMEAGEELYGPKSEHRALLKSVPADTAGRLEKSKEDIDLARTIDEGTFNTSVQPDSDFFVEYETVKLLLHALESNKAIVRDSVPDIIWIKLSALHDVVQEYGTDSDRTREAARLVEQLVTESARTLENVYDNRAVVMVITETALPYMMTRKTRSLLQVELDYPVVNGSIFMTNENDSSLAYPFENDFHVAFALIFFTSVMLILTVLAVSVGIWFMDPGRDSIIYRMTSQRKKD